MTDTPRLGHAPIKMIPRVNADFWQGPEPVAGEFYWQFWGDKRVLYLMLPHRTSKGQFVNIPTHVTIDHKNDCGASWSWDGNENAPTLSPSIHTYGVWHGFVQKGELVEA